METQSNGVKTSSFFLDLSAVEKAKNDSERSAIAKDLIQKLKITASCPAALNHWIKVVPGDVIKFHFRKIYPEKPYHANWISCWEASINGKSGGAGMQYMIQNLASGETAIDCIENIMRITLGEAVLPEPNNHILKNESALDKSTLALQSIRKDMVIANHTALGSSIAKFRKANLGFMLQTINVGFMDGGCLAFALSMKSLFATLSPDTKTQIVSIGMSSADHAVLEVMHPTFGFVYIDAEGMALKDEICRKMIELEGLSEAKLYEFDFDQDEVLSYEEIGLPAQLLKRLSSSSVADEITKSFPNMNDNMLFSSSENSCNQDIFAFTKKV
jgi:hypothetical protein